MGAHTPTAAEPSPRCTRALAQRRKAEEKDAMVCPWRQAHPRLDFNGLCPKDGWMTDLARRNRTGNQTRTTTASSATTTSLDAHLIAPLANRSTPLC